MAGAERRAVPRVQDQVHQGVRLLWILGHGRQPQRGSGGPQEGAAGAPDELNFLRTGAFTRLLLLAGSWTDVPLGAGHASGLQQQLHKDTAGRRV